MLIYLNRDRKDFALAPLVMQEDLRYVAKKHSRDMAKKDYFAHENFRGQSPADRLKVSRVTDSVSGENLAKIGGYPKPVREAEEGLMRSPGHRANILNKHYNCVGIGIIKSKDGVYYFTQNFAKRILKFYSKIPKVISVDHGLRLRGIAIDDVTQIFYQVKKTGETKMVGKGVIDLDESGKFDARIRASRPGKYDISLFVPTTGKKMVRANHFDIRVRKWWFWR